MKAIVREEKPGEEGAIFALNVAAFPTDAEARLVDALRHAGALTLSLVAVVSDSIVGHIAFSPVVVTSASGKRTEGVGLAPMAVAPAHQRQGIGGALIDHGLRRLRDAKHSFCVVLGHKDYYPRHGFRRAKDFDIRWENPVPEDVFFACELSPGGLTGVSGTVRYRPELDAV